MNLLQWRPRACHSLYPWLVQATLLVLFVALAVVAHSLRSDPFDLWVTEHVQQWRSLDWPLSAASWPGYSPQDWLIDAAAVLCLLALGQRRASALLLISVAGGGFLDQVVKLIVARPRPSGPQVHVVLHLESYSYPSGHVVAYCSLFGFLAYLAWKEVRPRAARWMAVCVCAAPVLAVGPSRIYLGEHWATDVLGGYLLGFLWLSTIVRLYTTRTNT